jgi:PAS domain S-box-containing protein
MGKSFKHISASMRALVGVFSVVALLIAAGGYWFYRHETETIRSHKYNDLKAIADLKVNQIVTWRNERIGDARLNSAATFLRSAINQWLKTQDDVVLKSAILARLELLMDSGGYENVIVTGTGGNVLFSLNPRFTGLDASAKQLVAQAVSSRGVVFGDFFRCQDCYNFHIDVASPVLDMRNRPVSVLILRSSPEEYLYPLIQSWPVPSKSAETLLVRRDGNDVLFLNQLRHRSDIAMTLRIPLSRTDVPAVQAVLGKTGEFEGHDYRGVRVVAYIRPVPDSTWFMVAKVDRDEILAEARYHGMIILLFVALSILIAGVMAALVFSHRQRNLYQNLFQSEREQREAQEWFRTTLYSIGDAVITTDRDGRIRQINQVAEQLTGWSEAEALGKPLNQVFYIVDEETRAEVENPIERVLCEGMVVGIGNHTLLIARDGTERPIADSGAPIHNEKGEISGVVLVFRDQTEERAAQKALKASEERLRELYDDAPVGYHEVNNKGNITSVNRTELKMLGYDVEDMVGQPIWNFIMEKEKLREIFFGKMDGSIPASHAYERSYLRKNGDPLPVLAEDRLLTNDKGETIAIRTAIQDITEHKLAEQKIASLQEQLMQSQKMEAIGRLAGGIAHDFNNLLTVIQGHAQLSLLGVKEGGRLRENIEEIQRASERAEALTRQLLAFSRRQIMEMQVLDLNQVLQRLDKMLRRVIGEDIELMTFLSEPTGKVKADPGQIEQVIMNIAVNARDAMPNGGKLLIETANVELDEEYARAHIAVNPGRYVMISLSDTGTGMTQEVKEQIFEPFFTSKERGKGTGLGLSTVYGIVKQSGGSIWIYSELGKGTTVKIYLPQVDEPLGELKEDVFREIPCGSETILIVEDEETVRKLTVRVLERQGYKLLEASDGNEALLLCEEFKDSIHLILTDVVMPGMSGRKLVDFLKEICPEIKALYMSGYTDNAIVHHGMLEEGIEFIQKPFTMEKLAGKVREVLDK